MIAASRTGSSRLLPLLSSASPARRIQSCFDSPGGLQFRQQQRRPFSASSGVSKTTKGPKESPRTKGGLSIGASCAVAAACLSGGYVAGRMSGSPSRDDERVLPSGLPESCCSCDGIALPREELVSSLSSLLGPENVIGAGRYTSANSHYLKGSRIGEGTALAVVTPTTLSHAVSALKLIVDAGCVVVPQGANTGLTGGSVPRPNDDSRPVVVLSMTKLDAFFPIDNGERVLCLGGTGLSTLSRSLSSWFPNRESHSTLGSSFLNPTTAAGVALGSGGTQLRKGPAYTDRAIFAKVHRNKWGENVVTIVNTLGIEGLEDDDFPFHCGTALEQLDIYAHDISNGYRRAMPKSSNSVFAKRKASCATDYTKQLVSFSHPNDDKNDTVSRCNAHVHGEECNRSEGKVLILATVHDTFPTPIETKTFWISFSTLEAVMDFRNTVCLDNETDLPISLEYINRDAFDVIQRSGLVLGTILRFVGISSPTILGNLWKWKRTMESYTDSPTICDRLLHACNDIMPNVLPSRIVTMGDSMDHHVIMTVGEFGNGEMKRILERMSTFLLTNNNKDQVKCEECKTLKEVELVNIFRFVAAPSFRTWCIGNNVNGFSVDYVLPHSNTTNSDSIIPTLTDNSTNNNNNKQSIPVKRMRYSHLGCNVVHEDIAYPIHVTKDDIRTIQMELKRTVEETCHGKLPAEHGHGIEYVAPMETRERWKRMDPMNVMNPGIGGTSSKRNYEP